jgi:hypothetical protein
MLATCTKYHAICSGTAIAGHCILLWVTEGRRVTRTIAAPLCAVVAAGACALALLRAFFLVFGGDTRLAQTVTHNASRMSVGPAGFAASARAVVETGTACVTRVGAVLLFLALIAALLQRSHRTWLSIVTLYVVATLGFNLAFFRLPGAGSHYLDSVVPAVAVLAAPAAIAMTQLVEPWYSKLILGLVAAMIQFVGSPPLLYARYTNPARVAAEYVAAHGGQNAGVLADSVAIEFYSGRPVRPIGFVEPDLLLRSLEGSTPDDISFVIVTAGTTPRGAEPVKAKWDALLQRHFVVAPTDIPGLRVYQRTTLR